MHICKTQSASSQKPLWLLFLLLFPLSSYASNQHFERAHLLLAPKENERQQFYFETKNKLFSSTNANWEKERVEKRRETSNSICKQPCEFRLKCSFTSCTHANRQKILWEGMPDGQKEQIFYVQGTKRVHVGNAMKSFAKIKLLRRELGEQKLSIWPPWGKQKWAHCWMSAAFKLNGIIELAEYKIS